MRYQPTPLLERSIYRGEFGTQLTAKSVYSGDNGERNASGNQTVFNGGRAAFVSQKSADGLHSSTVDQKAKSASKRTSDGNCLFALSWHGLFQASLNRGELAAKGCTEAVHSRNNRKRNACCDQTILNGRCA